MPNVFTRIDETTIVDHPRLHATDEIYYIFEYTSQRNYAFGATNNLISNLKKKPSRSTLPDYKYKRRDMRACSESLAGATNHAWLNGATLVADSARYRPPFRFDVAHHSDLIPPTVPG